MQLYFYQNPLPVQIEKNSRTLFYYFDENLKNQGRVDISTEAFLYIKHGHGGLVISKHLFDCSIWKLT